MELIQVTHMFFEPHRRQQSVGRADLSFIDADHISSVYRARMSGRALGDPRGHGDQISGDKSGHLDGLAAASFSDAVLVENIRTTTVQRMLALVEQKVEAGLLTCNVCSHFILLLCKLRRSKGADGTSKDRVGEVEVIGTDDLVRWSFFDMCRRMFYEAQVVPRLAAFCVFVTICSADFLSGVALHLCAGQIYRSSHFGRLLHPLHHRARKQERWIACVGYRAHELLEGLECSLLSEYRFRSEHWSRHR